MNMISYNVKDRYTGIQSMFGRASSSACLFLALLSIVEDFTDNTVDFIDACRVSVLNKVINPADFYVLDSIKLLKLFTNKNWSFKRVEQLPDKIPDEMYTIEKWFNKRTGYTHFKRRGFDTLEFSVTVKEGKLVEYYVYTVEL